MPVVVEPNTFDKTQLSFVETECTIPGTNLTYTRFNILYKDRPLLIDTPKDLVSYGMRENKLNQDGDEYSFSLELNDTVENKTPFMLFLDEISSSIKEGLEDIIGKEISSKLPSLYLRTSTETQEEMKPCIYPQVIYDRRQGIFYSNFINDDEQQQEENLPAAVFNAPLYAQCRLRVDNVNLFPNEEGKQDVRLHLKLSECVFRKREMMSQLRPTIQVSRKVRAPSFRSDSISTTKSTVGKQRIYKYGEKRNL